MSKLSNAKLNVAWDNQRGLLASVGNVAPRIPLPIAEVIRIAAKRVASR